MASDVVPQAPQTLSCPLLELPPELRLLIYAYTHSLDLDLEYKYEYSFMDLSKAWASTPLVKLAGTCRLIAKEARDYVRSMPASQRAALLYLSGTRGPSRHVTIRLSHIPCPMVDLRCVIVRYNFEKFKSTAYDFPAADQDSAIDGAMRDMGHYLFIALRRLMAEAASSNATTNWTFCLQIKGLQPKKDGESYTAAVRRLLHQPEVDPASAERLVQEIFRWACDDAPSIRNAITPQLAGFAGIPLHLSMTV